HPPASSVPVVATNQVNWPRSRHLAGMCGACCREREQPACPPWDTGSPSANRQAKPQGNGNPESAGRFARRECSSRLLKIVRFPRGERGPAPGTTFAELAAVGTARERKPAGWLEQPQARFTSPAIERVEARIILDPYLSLVGLAAYSGLSVRKLRTHLGD